MLSHWDLLAGSFCFAGEIHMETHSHLYRITLQSASYYTAIYVMLPPVLSQNRSSSACSQRAWCTSMVLCKTSLLIEMILIGHELCPRVASWTHQIGQIVLGICCRTYMFGVHLTIVPEPEEHIPTHGEILADRKVCHVFKTRHIVIILIELAEKLARYAFFWRRGSSNWRLLFPMSDGRNLWFCHSCCLRMISL